MKKYTILATLMLLSIGLGSFQYWAIGQQETATATIGTVEDGLTVDTQDPVIIQNPRPWRPFGVKNDTHYLYNITPQTTYTGNYTATLYLTNADKLGEDFIYLIMKMELKNSSQSVDTKWLGLENGRVQFNLDKKYFAGVSDSAYIYITGGAGNIPWWKKTGTPTAPKFVIDVEEIG